MNVNDVALPLAAIHTTCTYCGVGCGVVVRSEKLLAGRPVEADGVKGEVGQKSYVVSGDQQHPANFGRLCSKGAALGETLDEEGRLLYPIVDGQRASWDDALDRVASGFKKIIAHPDADQSMETKLSQSRAGLVTGAG